MPVSKKRKRKNGKVVGNGSAKNHKELYSHPDAPVGVSLQDLINAVAYQEYVKDGTIVDTDAVVELADDIPVNVCDEEGNKRQIGTASQIYSDPERVNIHITDPFMAQTISGPIGNYSIDEENTNGE